MISLKKNYLAIAFAIFLVGSVSYYIYNDLNNGSSDNSKDNTVTIGQPGITLDVGSPTGNYKIEVLDNKKVEKKSEIAIKSPDLSRVVTNQSRLSELSFNLAAKNIADLTKGLRAEPKNESKWLDLASYRKMIGDNEATAEILNYLTIVWSNDFVPYNNLADLYQNYDTNYQLAEKNWLKTIELKPVYVDAYINLYELYNDLYQGQKGKALPVLLKGLQNNSKNLTLLIYTARHYLSLEEKTQAMFYYNKAIEEAKAQGNNESEASFRVEMSESSK